jgi:hypothetical protein
MLQPPQVLTNPHERAEPDIRKIGGTHQVLLGLKVPIPNDATPNQISELWNNVSNRTWATSSAIPQKDLMSDGETPKKDAKPRQAVFKSEKCDTLKAENVITVHTYFLEKLEDPPWDAISSMATSANTSEITASKWDSRTLTS